MSDATSTRPRALSGLKPTGPLHLGNLEGALRGWLALQETHEIYCLIADWHAFTVPPVSPDAVRANTREVVLDCLAAGIDPDRAALFRQSDVPEHAELHLLLSMVTPVAWLERVPTYKHLVSGGRVDAPSLGLLGYPVLQAADILLYGAAVVPVGRDQLPHLELAREIARRFNHLFGEVLVEPQAHLTEAPVLPGLDGAKMSKDRRNTIDLRDDAEETRRKVMSAYTTPTKLRATDPGVPEGCTVCQLRRVYDPDGWERSWEEDRRGERGCVQNKRELAALLERALAPLRARRRALAADPALVEEVLRAGAARARAVAARTLARVRAALGLGPADAARAP